MADKMNWSEVVDSVVGFEPPEDTFELRNNFIESVLLDKDGKPITNAPLHRTMQKYFHKWMTGGKLRMMVMAPYNSGKSQQFPIALLVYLSTMRPELEHLIISADQELASKRIVAIRDLIASSEYHEWCSNNNVPPLTFSKKDSEGSSKIIFESKNRTGNPSVEAHGVATGGAGQRASYLWLDDICSAKDKESRAWRDNVYNRASNIWIKRLHDDGKVIGVMTPYHEEDANMRFCSGGTFNVLKIAVNSDKSGYNVEVYESDLEEQLQKTEEQENESK